MKVKLLTFFLFSGFIILTGCNLTSESEQKLAYRTFELYREVDGSMPTKIESDLPNEYRCIELFSETTALNINGDGVWLFYELADGENYKNFILSSEHDMLADPHNLNEEDYVEEISVKYFCVSPDLALNNLLEETYSNLSESAKIDRYVDEYLQD
jgi:hypothetical protein